MLGPESCNHVGNYPSAATRDELNSNTWYQVELNTWYLAFPHRYEFSDQVIWGGRQVRVVTRYRCTQIREVHFPEFTRINFDVNVFKIAT